MSSSDESENSHATKQPELGFIDTVNYRRLVDLLLFAKERIILSLPSIHDEMAEALIDVKKKGVDLRVIINPLESTFRNGFGDMEAIDKLRKGGISLFENPNSAVSFLVCDDFGYFTFPESRVFSDEAQGPNAVKIDAITITRLIAHFFPPTNIVEKEALEKQFNEAIEDTKETFQATIEQINRPDTESAVSALDEEKLDMVKEELAKNPPLRPDVRRKINTYNNKIQFVEFSFEGSHVTAAKVHIPVEALPLKDDNLKRDLETRLRLFADIEKVAVFNEVAALRKEVDEVRKVFLTPISSREKNVLSASKKTDFEKKVSELAGKTDALTKKLPIVIQQEILNAKRRIKDELSAFLKANPPEELKKFKGRLLDESVEDTVASIVHGITFPKPEELAGRLSIKMHIYDLTFQDLQDDELLQEFIEKGVMQKDDLASIVSMRVAFVAKPVIEDGKV